MPGQEITVGGTTYLIVVAEQGGHWIARAERADNHEPFGAACVAASEAEAAARLTVWLQWQYEHATALHALQQAERAFQRTVAGSAFVNPTEGPTATELQKEALDEVETVRRRLDEIRARRPESPSGA